MRPTPEEIIDGLDYSLQQEIRPELSSAWSIRVADAMTWALRHLKARWLHERDVVLAEQSELVRILTAARARIDLPAIDWTPVDAEFDDTAPLANFIAHTMRLRTVLDGVIDALPPQSSGADAETWRTILSYLQNQIDREESLLYPRHESSEGPTE